MGEQNTRPLQTINIRFNKMDRNRLTHKLYNILGVKNWNRLQMKLKFYQNFSKLCSKKAKSVPSKCYVYMADGLTAHGGIATD